jgi:hypothetical protein
MKTDSLYSGIQQALKGLEFGHIQLVVHDGQVVRIERLEKIRVLSQAQQDTSQPEIPEAHSTTPKH